jgi:DNA-binding transcriptional LysR family regulator
MKKDGFFGDVSLRQIEAFLAVAELLSQTDAARALYTNQSAVSRHVAKLEDGMQALLFSRTNRGMELTGQGMALYEQLKPAYEQLRGAFEYIQNAAPDALRIGCMNSPEIIAALDEARGETAVRTDLLDAQTLLQKLMTGELGAIVLPEIGFSRYIGVETKRLKPLTTYIAVCANSPLAESAEVPIKLLKNETLYNIFVAETGTAELRAVKECRRLGFEPRAVRYVASLFALEMAVKNGRGFTFTGTDLVLRFGKDIKLYPIDDPAVRQYAILAYNPERLSPQMRKFIEAIPESNQGATASRDAVRRAKAINAVKSIQQQSIDNGLDEITLEEINAEIDIARKERKR